MSKKITLTEQQISVFLLMKLLNDFRDEGYENATFNEKYDAFDDVGGKLSFALALLDKNNTGLILNAVHSRDNCFLYLKEIVKGESYVVLSQEEVEALRKAVNFGLGEIEKE